MKKRKITYKLYPTQAQIKCLLAILEEHRSLYNRALAERIHYYQETDQGLSYADQCKALTDWRKRSPSLDAVNAQSLQVTLKRLDLAFQGFFLRLKKGEKPGFPRFKSSDRYKGWGYKTHGDGWRLLTDESMKHGKLRYQA